MMSNPTSQNTTAAPRINESREISSRIATHAPTGATADRKAQPEMRIGGEAFGQGIKENDRQSHRGKIKSQLVQHGG